MKLNKSQALALLNKFKSAVDMELYIKDNSVASYQANSDGIYAISYDVGNTLLRIESDRSKLRIELKSPTSYINGTYLLWPGIFRIFDSPWRKWKGLKKTAQKARVKINKKRDEDDNDFNSERFNRILNEAYPNDINNILLEVLDDK